MYMGVAVVMGNDEYKGCKKSEREAGVLGFDTRI